MEEMFILSHSFNGCEDSFNIFEDFEELIEFFGECIIEDRLAESGEVEGLKAELRNEHYVAIEGNGIDCDRFCVDKGEVHRKKQKKTGAKLSDYNWGKMTASEVAKIGPFGKDDHAVTITCYGKTETYKSKKAAMKFYELAARCCDGSEAERYSNIFFGLYEGRDTVTDEYWKY